MAAYYRRRKKYRQKYTAEERQKYWDERVLADPDKLPKNYEYHVPQVPALIAEPSFEDVGLSNDIHEIVAYHTDKKAKVPDCFYHKFGDHLVGLILAAGATAIVLSIIVAIDNSSRRHIPILELVALVIGVYGGYYSLWWLWLLLSTPVKAARARLNFSSLSSTSGPSALLGGKSLKEVSLILLQREESIARAKEEHKHKCEARLVEIWRRHRLRIARLKTNAELTRLKIESIQKADSFETANFSTLAMNPDYWTQGSSTVKGKELERKFAHLLQAAGYKTRVTRDSGDDGIDIIATKDGEHIVVQCKNYMAKVGASEIRDFAGSIKFVREKSPKAVGWLVAPNGFSESTFKKFHRPGDLELWEFSDMQGFVIETFKQIKDASDEDLEAV